ncbi:MAG: methionyl-tRNA formyltransferase [Gammaproteobacteria bacterium]|nr:methionyl-tRNA formyltransferase [Gammaproteobacteria bacterium]
MRIVFAGTPVFAAKHLQALLESPNEVLAVITQPDKRGKRGRSLVESPVKKIARENGLTVLQPVKLQKKDLSPFSFELLVVVAFGQILDLDVLETPAKGCINVHASLLPRWRGAAPIQRSILAGDKNSGVTIMQMDDGLDTGNILASQSIRSAEENSDSLSNKLCSVGQGLLLGTLGDLDRLQKSAIPQNDEHTTYAPKVSKDEARINWLSDSTFIERQVRAFYSSPVAYTFIDGIRLKIFSAKESVEHKGNAGEIIDISKDGVLVGTKTRAIRIKEIQLDQGKGNILKGADIQNGWSHIFSSGKSFDQP